MRTKLLMWILPWLLLIAGSASAQLMMQNYGAGGASGTPAACAGVIDASVGCPLPMLGM